MRVLFYFTVILLFLSGCVDKKSVQTDKACFEDGSCIKLEVVEKQEELMRGLMFKENLPSDSGMLFIFQKQAPYSFWMKNMKFPIDIIWINDSGRVVHVERSVPPCKEDPCPVYTPKEKALYVLEVSANKTLDCRIDQGSEINIQLTTTHPPD